MPFYLQERLGNAPPAVRVVYYGLGSFVALLGLAVTVWWCVADAGVFHWLKGLQLRWLGFWHGTLTILLTVLLTLGLIFLPAILLLNLLIVALVPLPPAYQARLPDRGPPGPGQPG